MNITFERIIKVGLGTLILTYGASWVIQGSQLVIEGLTGETKDPEADLEISHAGA